MRRSEAEALDARDPLAIQRAAFDLPEGVLYLDGNSLGPPPRRALDRLRIAANTEWRDRLIRSWNSDGGEAGWIDLPRRAGAKIARLIGAREYEVVVCDSVSVNLFKVAAALVADSPGRALCVDADEFPTDQYVLEGVAATTGATLVRLDRNPPPAGAVVIRSLVHYKSAAVADMAATERDARDNGSAIIWDLSHAVGLMNIDLAGTGARFAVGCGYKYLNGGPGAPAFVYCAASDAKNLVQPISGWMGHAAPFDFLRTYAPAEGVLRFAAGTPPILSLSALDAALEMFEGLDLALLEAKARALADLFLEATRDLPLRRLPLPAHRGGHICFASRDGYAIMQALIARGVIGDFRAPDLMRFGFSPLFLSYVDVWKAAEVLRDVLEKEDWRRPEFSRRGTVT